MVVDKLFNLLVKFSRRNLDTTDSMKTQYLRYSFHIRVLLLIRRDETLNDRDEKLVFHNS